MLGAHMLGAIVNVEHLVQVFGYPLLFLIVMCESGGVPVPGETGLITAAVLASQGKLADRAGDPARRHRGDRRRQHRLSDRPQGRALDACSVQARSCASARKCSRSARPSSNATAPRPSSSGASCSACACGPPGWPARPTCTGARSCCGTRSAGICWATAIGLIAYFLGQLREQRDRSLRPVRAGRRRDRARHRVRPAPAPSPRTGRRRAGRKRRARRKRRTGRRRPEAKKEPPGWRPREGG